jgi:hypothetical protein
MAGIIITIVLVGIIAIWALCGIKKETEEEAKEKAALLYRISTWWVESKFNSFEVVDKYISKDDKYRQVLRQVATNKYFDIDCGVNAYYVYQKGDYTGYTKMPYNFAYLTQKVVIEFNKDTGSNIEYKDVSDALENFFIF